MIELAIIFIGLSLLLYVILGGADFGAGILEIFTGKKGVNTISKAIAPVWEANHIWLIVVIVILFNAFPEVYSTVTLYLHLPILLVLFGIIFRGTAFTFRYYDPFKDRSHRVYTFIFKLFSLLTPFFLGVTLGAVILGRITTDTALSFQEQFVAPWLNWFCVSLGVFVVILFAFLSAVYLAGEPAEPETNAKFRIYAKRLLISLIMMGAIVFLIAQASGLKLLASYFDSWISITCAIGATILLPLLLFALNKEKKNLTRLIVGAQTASIIIAWFGAQYPSLIILKGTENLTIFNTVAPDKSLQMMILALFIGLAFVIPLLIYLFKVFKFSDDSSDI